VVHSPKYRRHTEGKPGRRRSRGLRPTRAQRELIESCDDVGQLNTWFDRALTATTLAMVFED
jgi:hypothetical protein